MTIIDRQFFPIMSYGCHLWDLNRCDITRMINSGLRKAIRRGLKMKRYESISDRLGDKFQERAKTLKLSFMKRAYCSVNGVVKGMAVLVLDKKLLLDMSE